MGCISAEVVFELAPLKILHFSSQISGVVIRAGMYISSYYATPTSARTHQWGNSIPDLASQTT